MSSSTHWLEIALPVPEQAADEVAAQLALQVEAARSGVWVKEREVVFWVDARQARSAAEQTRAFARARGNEKVVVREAQPESEWRDAWKKYFRTTRIARQLIIVPSWDSCTPEPGDLLLHLDPGQAFGTGDHASTRLLLGALQELKDQGFIAERVLDVGTGSGILALAAARLWPESQGLALDCDPLAVTCARENLTHNQVEQRYAVAETDVAAIAETYDLVLANIQADVLCALADTLVARLRTGGRLLLSGLLSDQTAEVGALYERLGLSLESNHPDPKDPQWSALLLAKP